MQQMRMWMIAAGIVTLALVPALAVSDTAAAGTCVQDKYECVKLSSKGGHCEVGWTLQDNGNNSDNDAEYTNYVCDTTALEFMAAQ